MADMEAPRVDERPFVILSDGVVTLRCLQLADAPAHLSGEDEDQVRWLNEGHRSDSQRLDVWIRSNQQEWLTSGPRRHFGIRDNRSDLLIGNAEAHLALPELALGEVNISYAVFPVWRGRGVAARAVNLLCDWLSTGTDPHTAVIRVASDNVHSRAMALAPVSAVVDRPTLATSSSSATRGAFSRTDERPLCRRVRANRQTRSQ